MLFKDCYQLFFYARAFIRIFLRVFVILCSCVLYAISTSLPTEPRNTTIRKYDNTIFLYKTPRHNIWLCRGVLWELLCCNQRRLVGCWLVRV